MYERLGIQLAMMPWMAGRLPTINRKAPLTTAFHPRRFKARCQAIGAPQSTDHTRFALTKLIHGGLNIGADRHVVGGGSRGAVLWP
jgi:hypothetical protein